MDDLDVSTHLESFVVPRDEHHSSVLDEHVTVAASGGVTVTDAQYLRPSGRLSAADVHQNQQQPSELRHFPHLISHPLLVDSSSCVLTHERVSPFGLALDAFRQPISAVHGQP